MQYLIDGHNLVPKAGLRLDFVEDEIELIKLLQEFGRLTRSTLDVYFDGAPVGHVGRRTYGRVTATFVSAASSADAAIQHRLRDLRANARNWTVVSSDRQVQRAAAAAKAKLETAEAFSRRMRSAREHASVAVEKRVREREEWRMPSEEVQHWLEIFKRRDE